MYMLCTQAKKMLKSIKNTSYLLCLAREGRTGFSTNRSDRTETL